MTENLDNAAWRRRVEEVEAKLRSIYVEDEQPEKT
jgi:hypothetical protein